MKNDIFNFRRFGKYFASDIRTCAANYGLSLLTISLLPTIVLYILSVATSLLLNQVWDGPGMIARTAAFVTAMICMVIIMPVKTYGKITEKQYGAHWLMIPASKLEKFLSMIILSCIVIPIVGTALYISIDALVCAFDHTCGDSLMRGIIELKSMIGEGIREAEMEFGATEHESIANFVIQLANPWLYIDDSMGMVLPFLLGALWFKSGKTVKTILALFAFSTVAGFITAPLMSNWTQTMTELQASGNVDESIVYGIFDSWIFRNIALVDTISDTIFNVGMMTAIYFRIKTLKH